MNKGGWDTANCSLIYEVASYSTVMSKYGKLAGGMMHVHSYYITESRSKFTVWVQFMLSFVLTGTLEFLLQYYLKVVQEFQNTNNVCDNCSHISRSGQKQVIGGSVRAAVNNSPTCSARCQSAKHNNYGNKIETF
jgi:hypothetical protein